MRTSMFTVFLYMIYVYKVFLFCSISILFKLALASEMMAIVLMIHTSSLINLNHVQIMF